MSTGHSIAAKEFLKNQTYAKWHDATFWAVRTKRDNMAYGLDEWEQLRPVCHQCREERLYRPLGQRCQRVQRDCLWHLEESQREEDREVEVDAD